MQNKQTNKQANNKQNNLCKGLEIAFAEQEKASETETKLKGKSRRWVRDTGGLGCPSLRPL
jgi:hypothetical protein